MRVKGTDNAFKDADNAVTGTDNAVKGSDDAVKVTDNAVKGTDNAACSLRAVPSTSSADEPAQHSPPQQARLGPLRRVGVLSPQIVPIDPDAPRIAGSPWRIAITSLAAARCPRW